MFVFFFLFLFSFVVPYREQLLFPPGNNTFSCVLICCSLQGTTLFPCVFVVPSKEQHFLRVFFLCFFPKGNNTFFWYIFLCCSLKGIVVVPSREQHVFSECFFCCSFQGTTLFPSVFLLFPPGNSFCSLKGTTLFPYIFFVVPSRE